MDIALSLNIYDESEIRYINLCRLYLNVTTVSDITQPDGINLIPGICWGKQKEIPYKHNGHTA